MTVPIPNFRENRKTYANVHFGRIRPAIEAIKQEKFYAQTSELLAQNLFEQSFYYRIDGSNNLS
ncbi:hypothetical protein [Nodularia sp. NIES-3585]|uniref:hypothetical protein n=1 Tax=Nodularia sp. NIES-3585 TaxID=1973477 RepID=UPI001C3D8960|nr:hypothetical protein [Nodularia sp. NIES-3585]